MFWIKISVVKSIMSMVINESRATKAWKNLEEKLYWKPHKLEAVGV